MSLSKSKLLVFKQLFTFSKVCCSIMLNVVLHIVIIMLNVIMLRVVALAHQSPLRERDKN